MIPDDVSAVGAARRKAEADRKERSKLLAIIAAIVYCDTSCSSTSRAVDIAGDILDEVESR